MSASFAAVIGIGALMAVSLFSENRVTSLMQKRVQSENLINLARETNESALDRTRSLLVSDGSLLPAIKVLPVGGFQKVTGSAFAVLNGKLVLNTPTPPVDGWAISNAANIPQLATQLNVEDVTLDGSGQPLVVIVSATTTTHQADLSKTITTKARFDLTALNAPPAPPAANTPAPGSTPAPVTIVSNTSPTTTTTDPCASTMPGAVTGVTQNVGIGNSNGGMGISNNTGGVGIGNTTNGVGIGNTTGGVGIGNTNGGIGIGNNGGIGIGSECGGIGVNAPNGCIGIGLGGSSCLGLRYK